MTPSTWRSWRRNEARTIVNQLLPRLWKDQKSSIGASGADLREGDKDESTFGTREATSKNPCSGPDATRYARAAARINDIAQGRPDLSFASRVAASRMSSLDEEDEHIIKWIIRYLQGRPVANFHYEFLDTPHQLVVYTDSDWK